MSRLKLSLQYFCSLRALYICLISFGLSAFFVSICVYIEMSSKPSLSLMQILNISLLTSAETSIFNELKFLPKEDYTKLIDFEGFNLLKNHQPCDDLKHQPVLAILVHSASNGFQKRKVIRETWGKFDPRSLLLFLVGTTNSSKTRDKIENEFEVSHNNKSFILYYYTPFVIGHNVDIFYKIDENVFDEISVHILKITRITIFESKQN
jgi:hypothetical protein